jgi:hypothetical protein
LVVAIMMMMILDGCNFCFRICITRQKRATLITTNNSNNNNNNNNMMLKRLLYITSKYYLLRVYTVHSIFIFGGVVILLLLLLYYVLQVFGCDLVASLQWLMERARLHPSVTLVTSQLSHN